MACAMAATSLFSVFAHAATAAAEPGDALAACALIGAAADRLVCYDQLAGRATLAPETPAAARPADPAAAPTTSRLRPSDTALNRAPADGTGTALATGASGSLLSKFWELDPQDKRGVFNFTGYRPNYLLPLHLTSRINRAPRSPTQAQVSQPGYRNVEAKVQLSLRAKLVQDLLLPEADLWFGFTQQSLWQIWNGSDSKPFRNTDYEPELIYVVPTPASLRQLPLGWQWRFAQVGLAHQSNGQSDPLSRSWNRLYLGAGVERGDWSLTGRVLHRLRERASDDNNPDLTDYRGRGDFQLNWAPGVMTTSLQLRSPLNRFGRGAAQIEWTYPVFSQQPNGLRWFLQGFTGYGETLTDYNFRQTSLGAGVTFLQF